MSLEKCKKIGETCARDLDPNIDCCEDGSFCNVLPHGWGTCTYGDQLKSKSFTQLFAIGKKSNFYDDIYSTVGIYNTCILLFIAGEPVCEDQIPDTVTCPTNPLNGKPLSCDDIDMGLSEFGIPKSTICKNPISKIIQLGDNPNGCIGGGNVEDYCRKTCSNCGINILRSLRQIKQLYLNMMITIK